MKETKPAKYNGRRILLPLQGLRALAFTGIFLSHTSINFLSSSGLGAWGVSVFLILSGFLMMINYCHSGKLPTCSVKHNLLFSLRKMSPLYPLHIVMMLSALPFEVKEILNSAGGGGIHSITILGVKIAFNITLTQSFVPHSRIYYSLNAVSWYLSICLLAYFCFPWILRLFKKNMSLRKAKGMILLLLILQVFLCGLAGKVNPGMGDGFTKWFVYNFPVMRMAEFIVGAALGYIYLAREDNYDDDYDGNIKYETKCVSNCLLVQYRRQAWDMRGCRNGKRYMDGRKADTALALDVILLVVALAIFSVVNPQDSALHYREPWWRYSCLFTLLNGVLVYLLAMDRGVMCRLASNKMSVFIGGVSSSAFLVHQMVIRYVNVSAGFIETDNALWNVTYKIIIPFLLTVAACIIWNGIYQSVKLKYRGRKGTCQGPEEG